MSNILNVGMFSTGAPAGKPVRWPFVLVCLYLLVASVANGVYHGLGREQSGAAWLLSVLLFILVMGAWFEKDSRQRGVKWATDLGLTLYIAWPIFLPYYIFATRKMRGFITLGIFLGVYIAGNLVSIAVAWLTYFIARH